MKEVIKELKTPIEHIPTEENYGLEYLAVFEEPGLYKLTCGWHRALFTPIKDELNEPDLDTEKVSYIYNTNQKFKAINVFEPCCMLVRSWDIIRNAEEYTDLTIRCGEFNEWFVKEYEDIDIEKLVKYWAPIIFTMDKLKNQQLIK